MFDLFDKCAELRDVLLTQAYDGISTVNGTTLMCQLVCLSTFMVLHVEVRPTL